VARIEGFRCDQNKTQTIYWDAKTPGLGLRVILTGSMRGLLGSFGTHEDALRIQLGAMFRAVPVLRPYLEIILSSFDHLYGVLGESIEKIALRLG